MKENMTAIEARQLLNSISESCMLNSTGRCAINMAIEALTAQIADVYKNGKKTMNMFEAIVNAAKNFTKNEGREMEDGDECVAMFRNGALHIALKGGDVKFHFLECKTFTVDADVNVYRNDD